MRHPRHRPRAHRYRTPGRSLPYAAQSCPDRPPFAFEAHPNPDLLARVVRPDDGHEVSIILAPRSTIGAEDDNFAVGLGEVASTLVVAVEYVDGLVDEHVTAGLGEPDATRRAIEHLVEMAANILRVWR